MRRLLALCVLLPLLVTACSESTSGRPVGSDAPATPSPRPAPSLPGEYTLVGDIGGTKVDKDATVTLTLSEGGTLAVKAVQPGETFEDSGTWSADGGSIQISFLEQGITGDGPYTFDGTKLVLPVLIFGEGEGRSEWTRKGGASTPTTPPPAAADHWSQWDLDSSAGAKGTKAYADALAQGADRKAAVQQALTVVRAAPGVASADLSDNGLNIEIAYADGTSDAVLTERLLTDDESAVPGGIVAPLVGPVAATPDPDSCETVPSQSGDATEPTREGINPGGGYGVSIYQPSSQPKQVTSTDSPPAAERTALLVSPQYDVIHPLGEEHEPSTIREVAGSNIECLQASLAKAGYRTETILGGTSGNRLEMTGQEAAAKLTSALTTTKYGVLYFLGHGASGKAKNYLDLGPVDMTVDGLKSIVNSGPITKDVQQRIQEKLTTDLGFAYDKDNLVLNISPDADGAVILWLHPHYFEAVQGKGASFAHTLVWLNACSSAATGTFQTALKAKAFVGWKDDTSGGFLGDASEAAFDVLTDKVRTVRAAVQMWQLHELWELHGADPDRGVNPRNIFAGGGTVEYPPITGQTHILIFRMRHGPSSASSDVAKGAQLIQGCYAQIWSSGDHSGLKSPACRPLEFGSSVPTEDDVNDALREVGFPAGAAGTPAGAPTDHGRWTLAD
jgi:hypothetical protein